MEKINNFVDNLKQVSLSEIDWSKLTDWEYLTQRYPTKIFIYEQWIYVIVLVNIFLSFIIFRFIAAKFFNQKPKFRFIRRISFLWFTNTILLLLYNIIRSEGVVFLSMRIFLILILILYFLILIYAVFYAFFMLPRKMQEFKKARIRDRYKRRKK